MSATTNSTFTVYGRAFTIVAEFSDTEPGMAQANAFMEKHRDTGLLHAGDGRLIIASISDKGTPVSAQSGR